MLRIRITNLSFVSETATPDRGTVQSTEGTLLRRMLALATRPSPLASSHTPRELAAAAIAIVQQLAAHVNGKS